MNPIFAQWLLGKIGGTAPVENPDFKNNINNFQQDAEGNIQAPGGQYLQQDQAGNYIDSSGGKYNQIAKPYKEANWATPADVREQINRLNSAEYQTGIMSDIHYNDWLKHVYNPQAGEGGAFEGKNPREMYAQFGDQYVSPMLSNTAAQATEARRLGLPVRAAGLEGQKLTTADLNERLNQKLLSGDLSNLDTTLATRRAAGINDYTQEANVRTPSLATQAILASGNLANALLLNQTNTNRAYSDVDTSAFDRLLSAGRLETINDALSFLANRASTESAHSSVENILAQNSLRHAKALEELQDLQRMEALHSANTPPPDANPYIRNPRTGALELNPSYLSTINMMNAKLTGGAKPGQGVSVGIGNGNHIIFPTASTNTVPSTREEKTRPTPKLTREAVAPLHSSYVGSPSTNINDGDLISILRNQGLKDTGEEDAGTQLLPAVRERYLQLLAEEEAKSRAKGFNPNWTDKVMGALRTPFNLTGPLYSTQ